MKPVIVRYTRATPAAVALPGVAVVRQVALSVGATVMLERLREQIEAGEVNEVIIVGPGACTGWRIHVRRKTEFRIGRVESQQHGVEQVQAMHRVVSRP